MHDQRLHMYVSEAEWRNLKRFLTLVYRKQYDVINVVSDKLCTGFQRKGKGEVRSQIFLRISQGYLCKINNTPKLKATTSRNDPKCQTNSDSCEINEDNINIINGIAHLMHCCMMNTHTINIIKKKTGAKSRGVLLLGVLRHNDCLFTRKLFSFYEYLYLCTGS